MILIQLLSKVILTRPAHTMYVYVLQLIFPLPPNSNRLLYRKLRTKIIRNEQRSDFLSSSARFLM